MPGNARRTATFARPVPKFRASSTGVVDMRSSSAVFATGVATAAVIALVSGCASKSSHQGDLVTPAAATSEVASAVASSSDPSTSASPPAEPVPSPSTPAPSPKSPSPKSPSPTKATPVVHTVDDTANGTTVRVHVGDTVRVTLHSTYWQMDAPSTSALKASDSTVAASPPGPGNVPGSGEGTVVTSYLIVHSGAAKITAQRTSCGEAMLCPPNMRSYVVTLSITAG